MDELRTAFDPEQFRRHGHKLVDHLADYLNGVLEGKGPVHPWIEPEKRLANWPKIETPAPNLSQIFSDLIEQSQHLHHPSYVGHQMAVPLPLTALADLATSVLNNSSAIYEMGPSGVLIEKRCLEWMAKTLGYSPEADGVFTSGGTLGNLTALLAARQKKGGGNCFLVSDQAHYSIDRAVKIMGWGEEGLEKVPVDEKFKMRVEALEPTLRKARDAGKRVIGISANACSTSTGSFDPLPEIAAFAKKQGLWFHADGAHGAATCLSEKYRSLVKGIEQADSVVWDAHKMLMVPALTTAVLFKDGTDSFETFSQEASYLFQKSAREEWYNPCHRTLECTKRDFAFRLYLVLRAYGQGLFADYVTRQYDLARAFARKLEDTDDFEIAIKPESNIVCFRYTAMKSADLDSFHTQVRKKIIASGKTYLVQAQLPKGVYLRTTIMNPFTTEEVLENVIQEVRAEFEKL